MVFFVNGEKLELDMMFLVPVLIIDTFQIQIMSQSLKNVLIICEI